MKHILLIDKPASWTSFDVVAYVRKQLAVSRKQLTTNSQRPTNRRTRLRVGHAGTLDPFATGLLIVLVGDETKNQNKYMKLDKEYEATLRLGYTSTTGDTEGEITKTINNKQLTINIIESTLKKFIGEVIQTPPKYSAIKIKGKKAYELVRAGKDFTLKPREIKIYELSIMNYPPSPKGYGRAGEYPELKIKVKCSSGTYIRSLAEDIGKALGCGAYLTALRRTKIGKFSVKDAKKIEDIKMFEVKPRTSNLKIYF